MCSKTLPVIHNLQTSMNIVSYMQEAPKMWKKHLSYDEKKVRHCSTYRKKSYGKQLSKKEKKILPTNENKMWSKSLFFWTFCTSEGLKWCPEAVETCSELPKSDSRIYLAIPKWYDAMRLVEKKLWKIKQKEKKNKNFPARTVVQKSYVVHSIGYCLIFFCCLFCSHQASNLFPTN